MCPQVEGIVSPGGVVLYPQVEWYCVPRWRVNVSPGGGVMCPQVEW